MNSGNVFELMRRVTRRDVPLTNTKILNQIFCKEYKMFSFDRKTKKLSQLEFESDIVTFMQTEIRPLFTMYCLFCNLKSVTYTQVVQHLNSRKHKKKMATEKGVILAVRDFNVFITCSFDKLSSLLYLTHLNSYLEEIVVAGEGSIVISGFLTNEGKTEPKKDGISIEVDPIILPNGVTKNESIRIKTCFHNFLDQPEGSDESEKSLCKSNISRQKNVTIYEFSDSNFKEYYADNMLFSLFSNGSRIWCSRCSLPIYTLEAMQNHLASSQHAAKVRSSEQVGFMCHICNVFYIELKGETLAHIHSSKDNQKILNSLHTVTQESIKYKTPLNQSLMKAYSHLFASYKEAYKFCCLCCSDLTKKKLMYLGSHEADLNHQRHQSTNLFFVLCKYCNVIYIDKGYCGRPLHFFEDHFTTHLSIENPITLKVFEVNGIHPDGIDMTVDKGKLGARKNAVPLRFPQIWVRCSRLMSQYAQPGISSREFVEKEGWCKEDMLEYVDSVRTPPIAFSCLACSHNNMALSDFVSHMFSNINHTSSTTLSFVKFCDICCEVLVSENTSSLQEHFFSTQHMNKLLANADISLTKITVKRGTIDKCKTLFSSNESLTIAGNQILNDMKKAWSEHAENFKKIEADLRLCLSGWQQDLRIELFGSQLAGLALWDSDYDVCLNIGDENIEKVSDMLDLQKGIFKVLVSLLDTRVPILKVLHIETKIQCDISFCTKWERHFSKLLKLYIDFDETVHWMMGVVREWFRRANLKTTQTFSSPSITWLVLFYLMQPDVRVIPSASYVLDAVGGTDNLLSPDLKFEWKDASLNLSRIDLLTGFFHYYSQFKFSAYKLCPLSGLVVPREATNSEYPVYIEDPFLRPMYTNNLADRPSLEVLHQFQGLAYLTLHMPWRII